MSLSATKLPQSKKGPWHTPVALDYQPAPVDNNWWDGSISDTPQKSGGRSDSEKSRETTDDEDEVRTKKVLSGGLKESKWAFAGHDPIKARKARGLPGTYKEEQKKNILSLLNEADRRRNNKTGRAAGEANPQTAEVGGRGVIAVIGYSDSPAQTGLAAKPRKQKAPLSDASSVESIPFQ